MTDILQVVPPKRRRSALESFDGCPYRYDQLYNRGVEDRGDESQRGIAFHEMAFRYIELLVDAKLPSDADLAAKAYAMGAAISQVPFHILDELKRLWRRHAEWFQLDLDAYLSAEEKQETDQFTWIPDLVYVWPEEIEILDWKTFYKGLTEKQAAKEFQLKFYLLQALRIWPGFKRYTFTYVFVRLGYSVRVTLTPEQIEEFQPEVLAIVMALGEAERTGQYPAIPGSHCTLCRLACPIVDNPQRLPIRLTTKDQALAAAGDVLVLEQRLKVLRKALGGWCLQEGPLVLNGQEFAHRPQVSRTYPAKLVLQLVGKFYGADAGDALRISASAVKRLDPQASVRQAQRLIESEQSTRRFKFKHQKAGELESPDGDDDGEDE